MKTRNIVERFLGKPFTVKPVSAWFGDGRFGRLKLNISTRYHIRHLSRNLLLHEIRLARRK